MTGTPGHAPQPTPEDMGIKSGPDEILRSEITVPELDLGGNAVGSTVELSEHTGTGVDLDGHETSLNDKAREALDAAGSGGDDTTRLVFAQKDESGAWTDSRTGSALSDADGEAPVDSKAAYLKYGDTMAIDGDREAEIIRRAQRERQARFDERVRNGERVVTAESKKAFYDLFSSTDGDASDEGAESQSKPEEQRPKSD